MAYGDLREFVKRLEKEGELKRVKSEVDPVLEIAEVVQRAQAQPGSKGNPGGMALLFEKPKGSRHPLLINAFGSLRRMELAFDVEQLDDVAARIRGFLDMQTPQGLFDKLKMLPKLAELGSFFPKVVKDGLCKEVVHKGSDVNLFDFPILKCWPQDGGRFITFPLVFTKNPRQASAMSGCTGCRCMTSAPPGCTGRRRSMAQNISGERRAKNPEGTHSCKRGDWSRPDHHLGRNSSDSARPGRNDVQRISEKRAGGISEVRNE